METALFYLNPECVLEEDTTSNGWSKDENKLFERALAEYGDETPNRWFKVASLLPRKNIFDVMQHYKELEDDIMDIEAGKVAIPKYVMSSFVIGQHDLISDEHDARNEKKMEDKISKQQYRKKGKTWTKDEHSLFLLGIAKYGRGDWRNISRNFVVTRSPIQVASHAQKYYRRQDQDASGKVKKRPSIHDITLDTIGVDLDWNHLSEAHLMATDILRLQEQNMYEGTYRDPQIQNSMF